MDRSYLFAPGHNPKLLTRVFDAGADAVMLDLEDAVPPEAKETARRPSLTPWPSTPPGCGSTPHAPHCAKRISPRSRVRRTASASRRWSPQTTWRGWRSARLESP
jgi:hypothetical protein